MNKDFRLELRMKCKYKQMKHGKMQKPEHKRMKVYTLMLSKE